MTAVVPITKEVLKAEILRLVTDFPDTINPTVDAGCVYWKLNDDHTISRCIIGEAAHNLGLPEPDVYEGSLGSIITTNLSGTWHGMFTDEAIQYGREIQSRADHRGTRWGDIPKSVLNS